MNSPKMTRQVVPVTFMATFLNAPCSSLRLAQAASGSTIYLIVGKANGETIFFPTDRSECVTKFENEAKVPVSAIAAGDLRNLGKSELVTITAGGNLTSLSFPCGAPTGPMRLFAQQIYPNICSAEVLDIDNDGLSELVVIMTDRVVRSYRFVEELSRMVPLNKWEMPTHISGWAIGLGATNHMLLSQSEEQHYVRLDFGPSKEVKVLNSAATVANGGKRAKTSSNAAESECLMGEQSTLVAALRSSPVLPGTQLVIPAQPFAVHLLHFMVRRLTVVDEANETECELRNSSTADIACVSASTLRSGLRALVTLDSWGYLNVYVWRDGQALDKVREPEASCRVMRDADHICCCAGPRENDERLFVGVVNIFNRIAIFTINLHQQNM